MQLLIICISYSPKFIFHPRSIQEKIQLFLVIKHFCIMELKQLNIFYPDCQCFSKIDVLSNLKIQSLQSIIPACKAFAQTQLPLVIIIYTLKKTLIINNKIICKIHPPQNQKPFQSYVNSFKCLCFSGKKCTAICMQLGLLISDNLMNQSIMLKFTYY